MGIIFLFSAVVAIFVLVPFIATNVEKRNEKRDNERFAVLMERYNSLEDFETSKKIERNLCFIFAIDEKNSKVAYVDENQAKIIPFEQIYKVEYIENSSVVASKSSIRTVGGALVGGV